MNIIGIALNRAREYYDKETYHHALRVAEYIACNELIPERAMTTCISLAIMHDLLEKTDYSPCRDSEMPFNISEQLKILSREPETNYPEYIENIKQKQISYPAVVLVKLADIKDHLSRRELLIESLKERYIEALSVLL